MSWVRGFLRYSKGRVGAALDSAAKKMENPHPVALEPEIETIMNRFKESNAEQGITPPPREVPSTRHSYYKQQFILGEQNKIEIQKGKTHNLAMEISEESGLDFSVVQEGLINARTGDKIIDSEARSKITKQLSDDPFSNINFENKQASKLFAKGLNKDLNSLNSLISKARVTIGDDIYRDLEYLLDGNTELTNAVLSSEFTKEATLKAYAAAKNVRYADNLNILIKRYKETTSPFAPLLKKDFMENPGKIEEQMKGLRRNVEIFGKDPETVQFLDKLLPEIKTVSEGLKNEEAVRMGVLEAVRNSTNFQDLLSNVSRGFQGIGEALTPKDLERLEKAFLTKNLEAIENIIEDNLELFPDTKLKLTAFGKEVRDGLAQEFFAEIPDDNISSFMKIKDGQAFIKNTPAAYKQANDAFVQFLKKHHTRDFEGLKNMIDRAASYDDVLRAYEGRYGIKLTEIALDKEYAMGLVDNSAKQRLIYDAIYSNGERIDSSLSAKDTELINTAMQIKNDFLGWAKDNGIDINALENYDYRFYSTTKMINLWKEKAPTGNLTNTEKIALSKEVFVEQQMGRIDWKKTAPDLEFDAEKTEWLHKAWEGLALDKKLETEPSLSGDLFGGADSSNITGSSLHPLLKDRKIFYTDGGASYDAMLDYGRNDNIFDNLFSAVKRNASISATTDIMGVMPKDTKRFFDNYFKGVKPEGIAEKTQSFTFYGQKNLKNIMSVLSEPVGYVEEPGLTTKAYFGFRSLAVASMLGNVVRYAIFQDPMIAFFTSSRQGRDLGNYFVNFYKNYGNLRGIDRLKFGSQAQYLRQIAPQNQSMMESQVLAKINQYSNTMFNITGTNFFTRANQASVGFDLMTTFAELKHLPWKELPIKQRNWWESHEINESLWEAYRNQNPHHFNETAVMNPLNYIERGENIVINQEMQAKVHFMIRQAVPEGTGAIGSLLGHNPRQVSTLFDLMRDGILTFKTTPLQMTFDLLRSGRFLEHGWSFSLVSVVNGMMIQAFEDYTRGKDFAGRFEKALREDDRSRTGKLYEMFLEFYIKGGGNGYATDVMGSLAFAPTGNTSEIKRQAKGAFIPPVFDALGRTATTNFEVLEKVLSGRNPDLIQAWRKAVPLQNWGATDYVINQLIIDNAQRVMDSNRSNSRYFKGQNRRAAKAGNPYFIPR